jgi:predicted Zn-dependent peptidase
VDWYYLGRVRTIEEIQKAIDGISASSILEHVKKHPPEKFTIVTLGANKLVTP